MYSMPTACAANERVQSNACVACPAGSTNAAGDDPSGVDTSCEWRPFQRREAGATDMQLIEERRVDDGDEGMLSLLDEQARLGRTEAESGESYARLLALM